MLKTLFAMVLKTLFAVVLILGLITPVTMMAAQPPAGPAPAPAYAPAPPPEGHPHIRAAIRELREAKHELETAAHDFGGHRKEAIEAIDNAIKQLQECLEYDKK